MTFVCDSSFVADYAASDLICNRVLPLYQDQGMSFFLTEGISHQSRPVSFDPGIPHTFIPLDSVSFHEHLYSTLVLDGAALSLLDSFLLRAFLSEASDMHLYSERDRVRIVYRIQGRLSDPLFLDTADARVLIRLLKFHSHMDVSKSFKSQDGRLEWRGLSRIETIRVSSVPTVYGEDFVCRFFSSSSHLSSFEDLGFLPDVTRQLQSLLSLSSGLVLVTGPTGSGKTTTLYQCLRWLVETRRLNVVSIEDPVESVLHGVRQIPVGREQGESFATILRAVLRQDPDVIMIGEIRDAQTAQVALEAAYTGHLVLATLHTEQVSSTLLRLLSYGLDPFWMTYCLKGIVSQRLQTPSKGSPVLLSELFTLTKPVTLKDSFLDPEDFLQQGTLWSFESDLQAKASRFYV